MVPRNHSPSAKFHVWQRAFFCPLPQTSKEENVPCRLYEELVARGLIAQVTDEEEIRDVINNGKATFYIGFDSHGRQPARRATSWP